MPQLIPAARGTAVAVILAHAAILGSMAMLPCIWLSLLPVPPARWAWGRLTKAVQESWLAFACTLLHCGLNIRLSLHVPADIDGFEGLIRRSRGKNVVVMCNHRSTIDWMFIWGLCLMTGRLGDLKIVAKEALKRWPGFGWAMQCFGFIFLSRRDRDSDLERLRSGTVSLCSARPAGGLALLIFPEGTDLNPGKLPKSHAFSKERGLPLYYHVLHPKTLGFRAVVEAAAVAPGGCPVAVWDVTMGYVEHTPGSRPTDKDLFFTGRPPREVHLRLDCPDLGGNLAAVDWEAYCRDSFGAKEGKLAAFYAPCLAGNDPDVGALSGGCQTTRLFSAPGVPSACVVGTGLFILLEAVNAWGLWNFPRTTLLLYLAAGASYEAVYRTGILDHPSLKK